MTRVRIADIPDIKEIYILAKELHEQSIYSNIKSNEEKFKMLVAGLMGSKTGIVLVIVDHNDKPQGFLLGVIQELFFSKARMATDIAIYSRKLFRKLAVEMINKFIKWAESKPRIVQITLGISSGIGNSLRIGLLYERLGFRHTGGIYVKLVGE